MAPAVAVAKSQATVTWMLMRSWTPCSQCLQRIISYRRHRFHDSLESQETTSWMDFHRRRDMSDGIAARALWITSVDIQNLSRIRMKHIRRISSVVINYFKSVLFLDLRRVILYSFFFNNIYLSRNLLYQVVVLHLDLLFRGSSYRKGMPNAPAMLAGQFPGNCWNALLCACERVLSQA
jgi:hypothetical protein